MIGTRCVTGWIDRATDACRAPTRVASVSDVVPEDGPELDDPEQDQEEKRQDERELDQRLSALTTRTCPHVSRYRHLEVRS
jgi:hypothetical protein